MGKKGGRNRMKRFAAPRGWDIERKRHRFVYKPGPGPHPISESYPLGVVLRELASMGSLSRELKFMLKTGKVLVDGTRRQVPTFPVGLFNTITVPLEGASFRLVPSPKGLVLAKVSTEEAGLKLCGISSKTKVSRGHIQYGLHDGRSIVDDSLGLSPGDAVLISVPSQKVEGNAKLEKGSLGLVLTGERAGQLGRISDVKKGTISREKMVSITLPSGDAEIPSRLVFPVGPDRPMISVGTKA